jgi:hypothetical protein
VPGKRRCVEPRALVPYDPHLDDNTPAAHRTPDAQTRDTATPLTAGSPAASPAASPPRPGRRAV